MSYTCHWHDETQTILMIDVVDGWTWPEAYEAIKQEMELVASVDHGVHVIFNLKNVRAVPEGNALQNIKQLMSLQHPNERMMIFVGSSMLLQTLINIIGNVYKLSGTLARYRFVNSMEQALEEIERYDAQTA